MKILAYTKDLFRVFFKWWWAALTAVATFLPFFTLPDTVVFSKEVIVFLIFIFCLLIFLTASVIFQGYSWFIGSHNAPKVDICHPAIAAGPDRDPADEVLLINSIHTLEVGQILTVFRETNRGIGCFGIIKVDRQINSHSDQYQCSPLWLAPIHKRDLSNDQVQVSQLSTSLFINYNDIATYIAGVQKS